MYCMGCQKEYENERFCPECGRMLVSTNTFDYQNSQEYQSAEKQRVINEQEELKKRQNKTEDHNLPKCPTCGSTNIRHISSAERGVNAVMFGFFGNKRKCQFECLNPNCRYRW